MAALASPGSSGSEYSDSELLDEGIDPDDEDSDDDLSVPSSKPSSDSSSDAQAERIAAAVAIAVAKALQTNPASTPTTTVHVTQTGAAKPPELTDFDDVDLVRFVDQYDIYLTAARAEADRVNAQFTPVPIVSCIAAEALEEICLSCLQSPHLGACGSVWAHDPSVPAPR